VATPEINVKQGVTSLASGSGSYAFGAVTADGNGGTASGYITFTIENIGSAGLTISSVTLSAGSTGDFDLDLAALSSPVISRWINVV